MKKAMKLFSAVTAVVVAFVLVCLAGCKVVIPSERDDFVSVTSVALTAKGDATSLKVGETLQLTATVNPKNATNKAVIFSSGDEKIATVSDSGLVTGVKEGEVTVTVTTKDGGKTASLDLTVESAEVRVTSVTLSAENGAETLKTGEQLQLTATVLPENATNKAVTFSSSDEKVATVSDSGLVTGVKAGEVTVTVTTQDGDKTASLDLTVENSVNAESVTLAVVGDTRTNLVAVGDDTYGSISFTAQVLPENATDCELVWTASDGTADVSSMLESRGGNCTFTPGAAGTYTVRASSHENGEVCAEYTVLAFAAKTGLTSSYATVDGAGCYNPNENTIGYIAGGDVITFTVNSETEQTVALEISVAVSLDSKLTTADYFTVSVNGSAATLSEIRYAPNFGWSNPGLYTATGIALKAGENTITLTAAADISSNLNSVTVFSAKTVGETAPEGPVTGTAYTFEGETATLTAGSMGAIIVASEATATDGTSLGNVNANIGATVTFYVKAEADCTASLYLSLGIPVAYVSNIFALTLNGTQTAIQTKFPVANPGWGNFTEFWFGNIALKAGNNTITFTVTGDCGNFDYMKLVSETALSVGEADAPITGTTYIFKGVDAVRTPGSFGDMNEDEVAPDGGKALGGINANINATLTFIVNAEKAGRAGLYLSLAFGAPFVEHIFEIRVNGTPVSVPGSFTATQAANWATYEDYFFANINLNAGNNTIVLTVTGACGNFYAMKLIADQTLTEGTPDAPVTGTAYTFKGIDAARTAGSMGEMNENETAPDGGKALGNINANIGATLTFKVNASEAGRAGLYLNLQLGALTVEDIFEVRVNGKLVPIPHIISVINSNGWVPWAVYEEYFLANIDLNAGENTIVLTVTGHCGNFDYMKLISESSLTPAN